MQDLIPEERYKKLIFGLFTGRSYNRMISVKKKKVHEICRYVNDRRNCGEPNNEKENADIIKITKEYLGIE